MKHTLFILSVFFMFSCGDSQQKKQDNPPTSGGLPGAVTEQQVFCLSMLANLPASLCWPHTTVDSVAAADSIITYIAPIIDSVLRFGTDNNNQTLVLSNWTRVWGPAVIATHSDSSLVNANGLAYVPLSSMTIFKDTSASPNYVVAIEATNPNCPYDWETLDLNVFALVQPPFDPNNLSAGYLSNGTNIGFNNYLKQLTDINQRNTALAFLQGLNGKYGSITVTGHSLGGALSPVYALYLQQTLNTQNVYCLSTAGPSPGNMTFVNYFTQQMNGRAFRVWNSLDVVPHAWEPDVMAAIDTIYHPTSTSFIFDPQYVCSSKIDTFPQSAFTGMNTPADIIDLTASLIKSLNAQTVNVIIPYTKDTTHHGDRYIYGSICNGGTTFTGATSAALYFNTTPFTTSNEFIQTFPNDTAFLSQLGNQHVAAYALHYNIKGIHEYARKRVQNSPHSAVNWRCNYGNLSATAPRKREANFTTLWALIHKYAWRW